MLYEGTNGEKVKKIVSNIYNVSVSEIDLTTSLDDLDPDPQKKKDFIKELEKAIRIEISKDEADNILTVQDAVEYWDKNEIV